MSLCDGSESFDNLIVGEKDVFSFDFSLLDIEEGIELSAPDIEVTLLDGEHADPDDIVVSTPAMDVDGLIASVYIEGIEPSTYCLAMTATTNETPARRLTIAGRLSVLNPCG